MINSSRPLLLLLVALASAISPGCSLSSTTPPPAIHAVSGKVVQKNGEPYTAGGAIQFKSTTDSSRVATGEIKPDGSFTIGTVHENDVLAGSIAGPHRVTVIGPSGADQVSPIYDLKTVYTIEPKENVLTIRLE